MRSYPEYDAIKAKNGGKDLIMKDYRDILNKVGTDLPQLFDDELQKSGNKKISTYINQLSKTEIVLLSEKILKEKYQFKDATTTLQEVFARSVLSREYGNAKIATHELQDVMRRGTPASKYQDLLNATIHQEKQISSATRVQTQFRSHLARQEYARQQLAGVPFVANPTLYPLFPGAGTPLGDVSIVSQEDFNSWLDTFGP